MVDRTNDELSMPGDKKGHSRAPNVPTFPLVIQPLDKQELQYFFNEGAQNLLKYFVFKAIFSQPELTSKQSTRPIHVPKEHIEQWLVQCLGADSVGAGNYPVDIINVNKKYVADAKMLAWKGGKSLSGETSLAQKFSGAGSNLDSAFEEEKYTDIVSEWSALLEDKFHKIFEDYEGIEGVYYFFIIREDSDFHICGMKVEYQNIKLMKMERASSNSIWIGNIIDSRYGQSKIYKAKKRMELRLRPHNWIEDDLVITFDNSRINQEKKDLLGMDVTGLYENASETFCELFEAMVGDPTTDGFDED